MGKKKDSKEKEGEMKDANGEHKNQEDFGPRRQKI